MSWETADANLFERKSRGSVSRTEGGQLSHIEQKSPWTGAYNCSEGEQYAPKSNRTWEG